MITSNTRKRTKEEIAYVCTYLSSIFYKNVFESIMPRLPVLNMVSGRNVVVSGGSEARDADKINAFDA